jgi:hypothetical protein
MVPHPGLYIVAFGGSDFITISNFCSADNSNLCMKLVNYYCVASFSAIHTLSKTEISRVHFGNAICMQLKCIVV